MVTWTRGLNLYGVQESSVVSSHHWLWKVQYVSICETLAESKFCSYSPCAAWRCGSLVALCHCSHHPVVPCELSTALTVLDLADTGTLRGRWGTTRGTWAHSRSLGNTKNQTWSQSPLSCLLDWAVVHSWNFLLPHSCWICASSVCLD